MHPPGIIPTHRARATFLLQAAITWAPLTICIDQPAILSHARRDCVQVQPRAKVLKLQNGATVHYDWLVLCPGSTYADGPIKNFKGSCEDRRAVIHVRPALRLAGVCLRTPRTNLSISAWARHRWVHCKLLCEWPLFALHTWWHRSTALTVQLQCAFSFESVREL